MSSRSSYIMPPGSLIYSSLSLTVCFVPSLLVVVVGMVCVMRTNCISSTCIQPWWVHTYVVFLCMVCVMRTNCISSTCTQRWWVHTYVLLCMVHLLVNAYCTMPMNESLRMCLYTSILCVKQCKSVHVYANFWLYICVFGWLVRVFYECMLGSRKKLRLSETGHNNFWRMKNRFWFSFVQWKRSQQICSFHLSQLFVSSSSGRIELIKNLSLSLSLSC